jgi:HK97 family phage major capsid protein
MNMSQMIEQTRQALTEALETVAGHDRTIAECRTQNQAQRRSNANDEHLQGLITVRAARAAQAEVLKSRVTELEAEAARDVAIDDMQREVHPTGVRPPGADLDTGRGEQPAANQWVRTNDLRKATVGKRQRWADQEIVAGHARINTAREQAVVGQHGSLGQMVRAMSTSSGSAVVPEIWAGNVIDRARNMAAVLKAGAEIVPMDAKTVQIGRLTGDPTAAFRTEGSAITASDPTFDNVTLDAKTMSALVVGTMEWFQDSDVDEIVENALAQAFANQLDLVALYGSITTGAGAIDLATPPNPRGVLGALNALAASSVLGNATNGTAQTAGSYYDELIDLLFTPQDHNETPNALIWNSKAARQYVKAYDTTGQPLRAPEDFSQVDRYVSNQIPSYTKGTMADRATDVFAGDWSQLLIGQRLGMTVQVLTERYAENGQIGIVVHWRGDVGIARPRAFSVYKALRGAL